MKKAVSNGTKACFSALVFVLIFSFVSFAQKKTPNSKPTPNAALPKVTQIDEVGIKTTLKPNGKPLLVNFWATWCDPCREEFPDLVKIDAEYKGKIDFITISLDDLAEIKRDVPKFLAEMKAGMPAYLLKVADESAVISSITKDWSGGLPFTILYNEKGEIAYFRQGKVKLDVLGAEINKLLPSKKSDEMVVLMDFVKIKDGKRDEALFFYENNWKVYRETALKKGFIHSYELIEAKSETNPTFDIILVTRYKNEEQHKNSEKNFAPILKEIRPNGALLKNDLKPEDFRQNVFLSIGKPIFTAGN